MGHGPKSAFQDETLEELLSRIRALIDARSPVRAPAPTRQQLAELFRASFFSSLARNEGRPCPTLLSFVGTSTDQVVRFQHPQLCDAEHLRRLAPSLGGSSVAVEQKEDGLRIVGLVRRNAQLGLATIRSHHPEFSRSASTARSSVLRKRERSRSSNRTQEACITSRWRPIPFFPTSRIKHRAVVWRLRWRRFSTKCWRAGVVGRPSRSRGKRVAAEIKLQFAFSSADEELRLLMTSESSSFVWSSGIGTINHGQSEFLRKLVSSGVRIGRMAAVDGAVVIDSEWRILGFGGKIGAIEDPDSIERRHMLSLRSSTHVGSPTWEAPDINRPARLVWTWPRSHSLCRVARRNGVGLAAA